jgi:hypothetical protein
MSTAEIQNVYIQTFEATVRFLAQQGVTRLRPYVDERSVNSSLHNWERLGTQEAVPKATTGLIDTPDQEYPFTRRVSAAVTRHTGDSSEPEDLVQTLIDPNSSIATAQGKAMRRAFDDEIIRAASSDTSANGAGGTDALPAGQILGAQGTPLAMTFDLVTEVSEIFMNNDIDPDEAKVFVIGPKQARKLLQLTEATSGDYNAVRPLTAMGYIESWMGYTWIVSTRLLDSSAGQDDSELYAFAMTNRALGLQVNKDIWSRVAEDPTKSFAWRIYSAMTIGAVRVEDEQLVRINIANTNATV